MTYTLVCPGCDNQLKVATIEDEIVCSECKKYYMIIMDGGRETPGRGEDNKFMKINTPDMPFKDRIRREFLWDCPQCRGNNQNKKDPRTGDHQTGVCIHCGFVTRIYTGGSVRKR